MYICKRKTKNDMKRILSLAFAIVLLATLPMQGQGKRYQVAGVAFYNLENLFDTIPNNLLGRDAEYTPNGARKWTGKRYWNKIHNLAYAISNMKTDLTPMGPAIIGVSEVENITVMQDLARDEQLKAWNLQVLHHDSPDRRGVDVGFLFNPRLFRPLNVTHHTLIIDSKPNFRTRDQSCVSGLLLGEPVSVIVNHWPSRLGGQKQSSYLREAAAALSKHIADSVLAINPKPHRLSAPHVCQRRLSQRLQRPLPHTDIPDPGTQITEIKQTKINQLIYETKTVYHAAPARRDARVRTEHRRERSGG